MAAKSDSHRLPARTGLTAIATVALLAACSGTQSTHGASAAVFPGPYAALGDSYTSGVGIPDQTGEPSECGRSSHDYPALVAQGLRLAASDFHDVSCQGATTADLTASQLTAVTPDTALVTVGIGGNDVDFAGTLTRCVTVDLAPSLIGGRAASDLAPCRAYYTSGGTDQIRQRIEAAAGRVDDVLKQIRSRAPQARILVVGYPALFPAASTGCAHTLGITAGDVSFLREKEVQLNTMLRQHASAVDATYVDTFTPSAGHDACADPAVRWIEPLVPASPAAPLHPNLRGAQGMADAVLRAVGTVAA